MELSMILFLNSIPESSSNYTSLTTWYADVSSFFAYNMMHTPIPNATSPKYYQFSQRFNDTILWGPKEKCEAEFCKAVGYTGSQDLCGIGVGVSNVRWYSDWADVFAGSGVLLPRSSSRDDISCCLHRSSVDPILQQKYVQEEETSWPTTDYQRANP